jgi:O-methyltransferase domain
MQAIMHDWPDEQAGAILRNVRAAMSTDSRLWVIDSILDPSDHDDMSKAVDMLMLTVTEGGRERTQSEWEQLFSVNGFRIESQTQLPLLIWIFTLAPT